MTLVEPLLSAYRRVRTFLRGWGVRRYAIEVAADYVDDFEIPGVEICDQWENADRSYVFVVQSKEDLRGLSQIVKGIIGVTRI